MKHLPPATASPFTLFAFGGSQGALGINSLVLETIPLLKDLYPNFRIIHQTGERDYARVAEGYTKLNLPASQARVEKFIFDMPEAYAQASLLICRAGSSTLSEIAAVGRAAVLVPFPFASDNHQQKNAEVFVNAGAAWMMIQKEAKGQDLADLIRRLIREPHAILEKEQAVGSFYKPDAAQQIVSVLCEARAEAEGRST